MKHLVLVLLLAGCSSGPLSLLTGGGPNVAANVQAGKTNTQTVGVTNTNAPTASVRPNSRVDKIDQSVKTEIRYELPPWIWVLGILTWIIGWVTDTPSTILRRKKRNG
jgi:hypothetical protein